MEPAELRDVIGRNVRSLAAAQGLSLNRLADLAGISRSAFYRVLAAEASPTSDTICYIAAALNVDPHQLLKPR